MIRDQDKYDTLFMVYGDRGAVRWQLLKAQAMQESSLDPLAESPAGAQGLCQFMPATWDEWSKRLKIEDADPFNPQHAIQCQSAYMAWLLDRLDSDIYKALAAYNWGIGNLKRVVKERGENWRDALPSETSDYLVKVNGYYEKFSANS